MQNMVFAVSKENSRESIQAFLSLAHQLLLGDVGESSVEVEVGPGVTIFRLRSGCVGGSVGPEGVVVVGLRILVDLIARRHGIRAIIEFEN